MRAPGSAAVLYRAETMTEFKPGLEGVVAFETMIAEPDREGGALRYRGVDIEELVGYVPYEKVWGLLVDESLEPGMPDPEPYVLESPSGNAPSDLQSATARLSSEWKLGKLVDIDDDQARDDLARLSATMMSIVAQSARGPDRPPVPDDVVEQGDTAAEKFLLRWRGEADPRHVKAIDTYWICTAEHGLNASTFTARITASTGADCGAAMSAAVGALRGPLPGGGPAPVLPMLDVADVPPDLTPAMFACARVAGWAAHILEEKRTGRLVRPSAEYIGPESRSLSTV